MSLYCDSIGTGPDVVLLHGWGWHGDVWHDLAAALARDCRVWIPDLPGHGRSRECEMGPDLTQVARTVGACVPRSATWVGWSLGGLVALAAAQSGAVGRLVLLGTTPRFVQALDWRFGWSSESLAQFSADVERDPQGTLKRFASLHLVGADNERSLLRRLRAELSRHAPPHRSSLRGGLSVLKDADLRAALAAINVPARVIHGERDQVVPWQAGEYLAQTLACASLVRIASAGHALPWSHTELLVENIREFLH
jgi:pimeloyl-[acyl-carrier protein] methyl ester esterase